MTGFLLAVPSGAMAGLTAGDIDDNLNFEAFLDYQSTPLGPGNWSTMPVLDLVDRVTIRIVNETGTPVPNAAVTLSPDGETDPAVALRAGNDGVLRFFPSFDGLGAYGRFSLSVTDSGSEAQPVSTPLRLDDLGARREFTVTVTGANTSLPPALDVMFVIDTTGSMQDEITYLTNEFMGITNTIVGSHQGVSVRFGLLVYRDALDVYVTKSYGFTDSADTMLAWLKEQSAGGGGDYPEAMDRAVREAVNLSWRTGNVARALFLVADAPPHEAGYVPMISDARTARASGIHVFPLAASGTNDVAEYLMRTTALLTQGRYLFLTDDSAIGGAHAEPSSDCYIVTPLAGLISRVVDGELRGMRVEPPPSEIIRTVGNYTEGRCETGGASIRPVAALSPPPPPTAPAEPAPTPAPSVTTKVVATPPPTSASGTPSSSGAPAVGTFVLGGRDMDGTVTVTDDVKPDALLAGSPGPVPATDGTVVGTSGQTGGGALASGAPSRTQSALLVQAGSLALAMVALGLLLTAGRAERHPALGLSPTASRRKLP